MNPKTFTIAFFTFLLAFLLFSDKELNRSEFLAVNNGETLVRSELQSSECDRTKVLFDAMVRKMHQEYNIEIICNPLNPDK
jgi:hypothetical protein